MTDIDLDSNVPEVTRLARAGALLVAQGLSVGFALNTFRLWNRIADFVTTNKMPSPERGSVLAWLAFPALAWTTFVLVGVALSPRTGQRLSLLEHWARRSSWVVALGLLPVLLHPTLWQTRTLMFLLATGIISVVAWWAIRLTQKSAMVRRGTRGPTDFERIVDYVSMILPEKLKLMLPLALLGIAVLYIVLRGVWLDPKVVPRLLGDPPVSVHSLRQAFFIMGHGGWLGLPVVALKFLRPPGYAHIFFWSLCIASAAFPLYYWVRSHLGAKLGLIVALCYLSMPALRTIGRSDVMPLGIAAGLFFVAALQWEKKRIESAFVMTLLTVGVHEQSAWWFFCLGLYLAGAAATRTTGSWLAAGAFAYFFVMAAIVLPRLDIDTYQATFKGLWGARPVGLFETLRVAFTNPPYVLARWLELQGLLFWLVMFVPFAFLPVVAKGWLLWMMPGIVFAIIAAGHMPGLPVAAGAAAHFVVLGFVASITTLARLSKDIATRPQANAAVIAWVFALIPCIYQLGGIWRPAL
jgi:hypothetical protein